MRRFGVVGNNVPQCCRHERCDRDEAVEDGDSGSVEVYGHVGGEDLVKKFETFLVGCYRIKVYHLLDFDRVGCFLC